MNGFPIMRQPAEMRRAVLVYVTKEDLTKDEVSKASSAADSFWHVLVKPKALIASLKSLINYSDGILHRI